MISFDKSTCVLKKKTILVFENLDKTKKKKNFDNLLVNFKNFIWEENVVEKFTEIDERNYSKRGYNRKKNKGRFLFPWRLPKCENFFFGSGISILKTKKKTKLLSSASLRDHFNMDVIIILSMFKPPPTNVIMSSWNK